MAKAEYSKRDAVTMISGPFKGNKGVIVSVRGLLKKTYDIALFNYPQGILERRPSSTFTLTKTKGK